MRTCYTAIFNNWDDLKNPFNIPQHWKFVCYTDNENIELPENNVWEIRVVPVMDCGPVKTARWYKINFHEHIDTEESLWIDATFYINCDLNRWWRRFREPMTCVSHPFDCCVYVDVASCIGGKKGNFFDLMRQANDYKAEGLPEHNGLISSGILMRRNTPEVRDFCRLWWEQIEKYSERDQIGFGYAAWKNPMLFNVTEWNYTKQREFIHIPHLHKPWRDARKHQILREYGKA